MRPAPDRYVLDASVGIKLFVDEPDSDKAARLLAGLAADPAAEIHVPDLFYIECANILLKYTRRFNRRLEDALADIQDLAGLTLQNTPTAELSQAALQLASQTNLSAYDACYAVLAQKLEIPLITADERLARTIAWAIWLGDIAT
jgi:predicted nucleic acid-binding protein